MAAKAGGKGEPSDAVRARCLVESELPGETDELVAKRYGVSARSISRWRTELLERPALAKVVEEQRSAQAERLDRQWARPLKAASIAIAHECVRLAKKSGSADQLPGLLRSLTSLVQQLAHLEIMIARGGGDAPRSGPPDHEGAPLASEWTKSE